MLPTFPGLTSLRVESEEHFALLRLGNRLEIQDSDFIALCPEALSPNCLRLILRDIVLKDVCEYIFMTWVYEHVRGHGQSHQ